MSRVLLQGNAESGSPQPELLPLDTKTDGSANQVSRNRQVEPLFGQDVYQASQMTSVSLCA